MNTRAPKICDSGFVLGTHRPSRASMVAGTENGKTMDNRRAPSGADLNQDGPGTSPADQSIPSNLFNPSRFYK